MRLGTVVVGQQPLPAIQGLTALTGFVNRSVRVSAWEHRDSLLGSMPPKRRRSTGANGAGAKTQSPMDESNGVAIPSSTIPTGNGYPSTKFDTNPDRNPEVIDGQAALRASPDADEPGEALDLAKAGSVPPITPVKGLGAKRRKTASKVKQESDSPLSDVNVEAVVVASAKKGKKTPTKSSVSAKKGADEIKAFIAQQKANKVEESKVKKEEAEDEWDKRADPDGDDDGPAEDADVVKLEASRPPPVNSDYLPLPWKGRLGYVSAARQIVALADFDRHASIHICACALRQSSPREPAALHRYWSTAIPSRIPRSQNTQPRTVPTRTSRLPLRGVSAMWKI